MCYNMYGYSKNTKKRGYFNLFWCYSYRHRNLLKVR